MKLGSISWSVRTTAGPYVRRSLYATTPSGTYSRARLNNMRFAGPMLEARQSSLPSGLRGGMIVFSVDVNAVLPDAKTLLDKVKHWLTGTIESLRNRYRTNEKIQAILRDYGVSGVSIGPYFRGYYRSDAGKVFSEKSIAIEMMMIDSATLEKIATELAIQFKQETVLVKDYNDNEIYFADRRDIAPTTLATTISSDPIVH